MKKISTNGLLIALAIVLSYVERFIPLNLIVPLPGVKLGLANIVTMFALFYLGTISAITITVLRCLLSAFMFGGMSSLLYSLSGALLALLIMKLLMLGYNKIFSIIGISMGGAAAHNIGQIMMAGLMMKNTAVYAYLPVLLLTGLLTGTLTATVSLNLFTILEKSGSVKYIKTGK